MGRLFNKIDCFNVIIISLFTIFIFLIIEFSSIILLYSLPAMKLIEIEFKMLYFINIHKCGFNDEILIRYLLPLG